MAGKTATKKAAERYRVIDGEWLACPVRGKGRLLRLGKDTAAQSLPLYCRGCHHEITMNVAPEESGAHVITLLRDVEIPRKAAQKVG